MKLFIVHDDQGNITSVGTPGPIHQDRMGVNTFPGKHVHIVERPDLNHTELYHHIRELVKDFRIEAHAGEFKLVRKTT